MVRDIYNGIVVLECHRYPPNAKEQGVGIFSGPAALRRSFYTSAQKWEAILS